MKKEDLRITKTRARLYRGLLSLMKKKTFEEIKISEICAVSSINRSTFYDHFNDKYELLEAMMGDMREDLIHSIVLDHKTTSIKEYYSAIIKTLLNHIEENKEIYSAVSKINSNSVAKDMMMDAIVTSATKDIDENFPHSSKIPTRTFVLFFASGFVTVILDALKDPNNKPENIEEILESFIPDNDFLK